MKMRHFVASDPELDGERVSNVSLQDFTVLLVTTRRWYSFARLAMAFSEAGFKVSAVCPGNHPVLKTSVVSAAWPYRSFKPRQALAKAIAAASAQLIVPCDEAAAADLHAIARSKRHASLRALIESSMGSESSYAVMASRSALHRVAEELKVRVPRAAAVDTAVSLDTAIATVGLPAFLKTDGSSGGTGVYCIERSGQQETAYRKLSPPPSMPRAVKRAVVDGDKSLLRSAVSRNPPQMSLQQAIAGHEANSTVFCWHGVVLASITVEVIATSMKHGPSTVVRRLLNAEIESSTAAIARSLHLSGVFGFDFVLQEDTGHAMLIEMNPRPTQTSHLALGDGRDLAAAAFAAVTGRPIKPRPVATRRKLIALFPGEWLRDSTSEYLELGYHDVPSSEPKLAHLCLRRQSLWRRMLTVQGWTDVRTGIRRRRLSLPNELRAMPPHMPVKS